MSVRAGPPFVPSALFSNRTVLPAAVAIQSPAGPVGVSAVTGPTLLTVHDRAPRMAKSVTPLAPPTATDAPASANATDEMAPGPGF
jgi:hypothetical protein